MDCYSGCIYDTYSAVVTEDMTIHPFEYFPMNIGGMLTAICSDFFNKPGWVNPLVINAKPHHYYFTSGYDNFRELILIDDKPAWKVYFEDIIGVSGRQNDTCIVNGSLTMQLTIEDNESCSDYRSKYGLYNIIKNKTIIYCDPHYDYFLFGIDSKIKTYFQHVNISKITTKYEPFDNCNEFENSATSYAYCKILLAFAKNDSSICEEIKIKTARQAQYGNTKTACLFDLAMKELDPDICDKIDTYTSSVYNKENCFINLIKITKDASICQRYDTGIKQRECVYFSKYIDA
jgi:hypothetical protein